MSSFRFGRSLRLTENREIQTVCQKGRKLSSPFLAIFSYSTARPHPRLCVSVSKKQVAKATVRHKIKRIVRESFRLRQHELPLLDMVVIIYRSLGNQHSKMIREKIDEQWTRLTALHKKSQSH